MIAAHRDFAIAMLTQIQYYLEVKEPGFATECANNNQDNAAWDALDECIMAFAKVKVDDD